jgi:hypothetical protein
MLASEAAVLPPKTFSRFCRRLADANYRFVGQFDKI